MKKLFTLKQRLLIIIVALTMVMNAMGQNKTVKADYSVRVKTGWVSKINADNKTWSKGEAHSEDVSIAFSRKGIATIRMPESTLNIHFSPNTYKLSKLKSGVDVVTFVDSVNTSHLITVCGDGYMYFRDGKTAYTTYMNEKSITVCSQIISAVQGNQFFVAKPTHLPCKNELSLASILSCPMGTVSCDVGRQTPKQVKAAMEQLYPVYDGSFDFEGLNTTYYIFGVNNIDSSNPSLKDLTYHGLPFDFCNYSLQVNHKKHVFDEGKPSIDYGFKLKYEDLPSGDTADYYLEQILNDFRQLGIHIVLKKEEDKEKDKEVYSGKANIGEREYTLKFTKDDYHKAYDYWFHVYYPGGTTSFVYNNTDSNIDNNYSAQSDDGGSAGAAYSDQQMGAQDVQQLMNAIFAPLNQAFSSQSAKTQRVTSPSRKSSSRTGSSSYSDNTSSSSGGSVRDNSRICRVCTGSGKCPECNGKGQHVVLGSGDKGPKKCDVCGGSGKCGACGGKGRK